MPFAPYLVGLELLGLQGFPSPKSSLALVPGLLSLVPQKSLLPSIPAFTNKILGTMSYVKMGRREKSLLWPLRYRWICSFFLPFLQRKKGRFDRWVENLLGKVNVLWMLVRLLWANSLERDFFAKDHGRWLFPMGIWGVVSDWRLRWEEANNRLLRSWATEITRASYFPSYSPTPWA